MLLLGSVLCGCLTDQTPETREPWTPPNLPTLSPTATVAPPETSQVEMLKGIPGTLTVTEALSNGKGGLQDTGYHAEYPLIETAEPLNFSGELGIPLSFSIEITNSGEAKILLLDGAHLDANAQSHLAQRLTTEFVLRPGGAYTVILENENVEGVYMFSFSE